MKTKLIIRLDTDDIKLVRDFKEAFDSGEIVIIPEHIKILIKRRDGYWEEVNKDVR